MAKDGVVIAGRRLLGTLSLLMIEGEEATVPVPDFNLVYTVKFLKDESEKTAVSATSTTPNTGDLLFLNWENPLGISTVEPMAIATSSEGEVVYVSCVSRKISKTYDLTLQFSAGGRK